jgi:hypothetical protein
LSDSLPLPLKILVTNLQAISTSAFMFFDCILRNWIFIVERPEFIVSFSFVWYCSKSQCFFQ